MVFVEMLIYFNINANILTSVAQTRDSLNH